MSLLDKYTIISNECVGSFLFSRFSPGKDSFFINYTNPFISSLFLVDEEYVKLAENYDFYLSLIPIVKEPKETIWSQQTGNKWFVSMYNPLLKDYPVVHLGDIETHFIHDLNNKLVLKKFIGRTKLTLGLRRIFIWAVPEMHNLHIENERNSLIKRFLSIDDSCIFFTNREEEEFEDDKHISVFVPSWQEKNEKERRVDFISSWLDLNEITDLSQKIIESKFK